MSSAPATQSASPRVTGSLLLLCAGSSIAVHLGSAVGAGVYFAGRAQSTLGSSTRIMMPDLAEPVQPPEPPLRLGRAESSTASIAWLGVTRDSVLGEGQESTVEQAELTIMPGEAQQSSVPSPVTPEQSPVVEPTPPTPQQEQVVETQPEPEPEVEPTPAEPAAAEPVHVPSESKPAIIEQTPPAPVRDTPEANPAQPEPERENESRPDVAPEPEPNPESAPPIEIPVESPIESPPVTPAESPLLTQPPSNPSPVGKAGKVDDRESVASIIRKAQEVRATSLNQPLSGEGLEIKPIEPKFPASVRFTQLPRNPIVLIRFNAQGRVVKAQFLRDEEKKRVYDTGSKGVDEPLINAIYQWRASGEQLEALNPDDPESTIEISMKIIFRDD